MKKLLFKLFLKVFKKEYNAVVQSMIDLGIKNAGKAQLIRTRHTKRLELEQFVSRRVICISNENDNPVIGRGLCVQSLSQNGSVALVVKDYVTGSNKICLGKIYEYTTQRFIAIFKLNNCEVISLLYRASSSKWVLKEPITTILSKEDIINRLNDNGFYTSIDSIPGRDRHQNYE